jgi:hypothetical protein
MQPIKSILNFLSQDKVLIFESEILAKKIFCNYSFVNCKSLYNLDSLKDGSFNVADLHKPKVFICENQNVDKSILIRRLPKDSIFATYIVDKDSTLFEYVGKAKHSDIFRKKNEGGGHSYYNESNGCITPFLDTSICDITEIQLVLNYEKISL